MNNMEKEKERVEKGAWFLMGNYEEAKKRMRVVLTEATGPDETVPCEYMAGLRKTVKLNLSEFTDGNSRAWATVTSEVLEKLGRTKTELMIDAAIATEEAEPAQLFPMPSFGMAPRTAGAPQLYVLTNRSGEYGASVITYGGTLEAAGEKLGGSFFMIPSSVHEWILVPDDGSLGAEGLAGMLRDVNDSDAVAPDAVLSYDLFRYDAEKRAFERVKGA